VWECSLDLASHVAKNVDFKDKTVLEVPFSFTQYSFIYNLLCFLAHLVIGLCQYRPLRSSSLQLFGQMKSNFGESHQNFVILVAIQYGLQRQ